MVFCFLFSGFLCRKSQNKYFLIANGYFGTLYLINRQITNLEVVPDTD
nr:MAG TPA: hypothetical protein [Caudoviricetes sp.]